MNGETKEFKNSEEYFDWLQESKAAAFKWSSCVDVIGVCNMTQLEIDIIVHEEGKVPILNKFRPDPMFPWKIDDKMKPTFENKDMKGKMTVLNWKNMHFNLIVGPSHMLSQIGSIEFQSTNNTATNPPRGQCTKTENKPKGMINEQDVPINLCDESLNEGDEIKVTYGEEENDDFTLPKQFSSKFHPNDSDETTSVTLQSIQKSMLFAKATANFGKIIKKSGKIAIKDTQMEVTSVETKDNKVEAIVEVTDKKSKGNVRLQIWGPKINTKRNKCTVLITKMEGYDSDLVGKVTKEVIKPLLEHFLVNVNAKGLLKESIENMESNTTIKKVVKFADDKKEKQEQSILNDCDICGTKLQSIRSLRRHKRQEHIETQPPGGTKRKSTTITTNVNNPRQNDPNASPPPKLRVLQNNKNNKEVMNQNTETPKETNEVIQPENNLGETNTIIKQLQDTVKQMTEQKKEDDREKLILQADLIEAKSTIAKLNEEQDAKSRKNIETVQDENEEYLTDSEEERVERNKHRGRGFLKAKRSGNRLQSQCHKCTNCNEQFKSQTELKSHMTNHQSEEAILAKSKQNGFRRTDPMSSPTVHQDKPGNQEIDTLCHICALRCTSKAKLKTHMQNHTGQEKIYNMSSLQNAIDTPKVTKETHEQDTSLPKSIKCWKCEKSAQTMDEMKKHMRKDHKTYRPCKNYSDKASDNRCSWNDKCEFSHVTLESGILQCWDCGLTFQNKNDLMIHRKMKHKVPTCKNLKDGNVCDKPDEVCWYQHIINVEAQPSAQQDTGATNVARPAEKPDFCTVTQKKAIPITVAQEVPEKMQILMMQMMQMLKEQHKATMDMMLSWTQKNIRLD